MFDGSKQPFVVIYIMHIQGYKSANGAALTHCHSSGVGIGNGTTAIPSSASASASSRLAIPRIPRRGASSLWILRASSGNRAPRSSVF